MAVVIGNQGNDAQGRIELPGTVIQPGFRAVTIAPAMASTQVPVRFRDGTPEHHAPLIAALQQQLGDVQIVGQETLLNLW